MSGENMAGYGRKRCNGYAVAGIVLQLAALVIGRDPKFDVPLVNVTVVAKQTALLPCSIDHLGMYKVSWQDHTGNTLTYEYRRIVDDPRFSVLHPKVREWHLQIRDVTWEDQGHFYCSVNTDPPTHKTISLHVKVPPQIIDSLSSDDTNVKEGETVALICNVTGVPLPRVTWYRRRANNGMEYNNLETIELQGGMLLLHNVSRNCDDTYECVADNGVPPAVSRRFRVTVEFPPEITLPNARMGQVRGKDTILACSITAFPRSVAYWEKDGTMITSGNKYRTEAYDDIRNVVHLNLYIKDVQKRDYGTYTCKASNYLGKAEAQMKLYEVKDDTKPGRPSLPNRPTRAPPTKGRPPYNDKKATTNPRNNNGIRVETAPNAKGEPQVGSVSSTGHSHMIHGHMTYSGCPLFILVLTALALIWTS